MDRYSSNKNFMSAILSFIIVFSTTVLSADNKDKSYSVFNKLKFFSWLVNDSPTMQRIIKSDDSEAIKQLEQARDLLNQAQIQFDNGEFGLADGNIAAGIKEMSSVSRRIKDEDKIEAARKKHYHELNEHIQVFSDAFERIAQEKNDKFIDAMLDREKLNNTVAQAEMFYREGKFALANHQLKQAADMVESALTDARHKDVLLHTLNFDSIEDEYMYEKKRNESYVMLISLLQEKQAVSDASRQYVNKIVAANKGVVAEAELHAADGDNETAVRILEQGTDKLSRALRMSGAPF